MSDTLTTITNLITSPPGQIAAGGVLAGVVWKFFEKIEGVLTDNTKLEIAVWLLGVNTTEKLRGWRSGFVGVFDRVFGRNHWSSRRLWSSTLSGGILFLIRHDE
jgi:hypothetical protein